MTAPPSIAAASASSTLLVAMTAENPAMAPTTIMPSTPRLRTPERSATSSPVAANTSGVAAIMALIRMLARSSMVSVLHRVGGRAPRDPARAVVHQHVGGEQKEQEHALEHGRRSARQAHGDLRRLAADVGQRQQQPGEQDADGMQPAQEGDDDGGEAVAARQGRHGLP